MRCKSNFNDILGGYFALLVISLQVISVIALFEWAVEGLSFAWDCLSYWSR